MSDDKAAEETASKVARDAAISQLVSQLTYLGVMLAVSWCVMNRDKLWQARQWWRQKRANRSADPYAIEAAEFRREVSDIIRGSSGPPADTATGIYGADAGRLYG